MSRQALKEMRFIYLFFNSFIYFLLFAKWTALDIVKYGRCTASCSRGLAPIPSDVSGHRAVLPVPGC